MFRRWFAALFAVVLAVGLAAPASTPAVAAPDDAEFLIAKSDATGQSPYGPGAQFSYRVELTCNSSIVDTCVGAQLTDTLPEPLVFDASVEHAVVVAGGGTSQVTSEGTSFTVDFSTPGVSGVGLPTGNKADITVYVQVPPDLGADYNGDIVNTAFATAENALDVDASATVAIDVPEVLDTTVQKTVDDHQAPGSPGIPALPGQPVDYTIGGGSVSNRSVDALVVQDPADGVASPFEGSLDFTGLTSLTPPNGADRVAVAWRDAAGVWHDDYTGEIPSDLTGIPAVDPHSEVKGLRFTFTSSTGRLPAGGEEASIGFAAETNDTVLDIPVGQAVDVPNTASSSVTVQGRTSTPNTADGTVFITNEGPTVVAGKSFANPNLLAGDQTTATLTATVGYRPVAELVIDEPSPGQPDLAAQGLDFDGFTDGVLWPAGATGASIEYRYAGGGSETLTADETDTLPPPSEDGVVGFTATFTGPIIQHASATLPFTVTAQPVDEDTTSTNTITTAVTDAAGLTGSDSAAADLTRQPGRVSTTIDKSVARDWLWAVPGTTTDVSFRADVNDDGPNASTVGSEYLIVSDPPDPQPGDPVDAFWNAFDLSRIVAGVPTVADLQVQVWDGQAWTDLPGGQLDGPGDLVVAVPAAQRESIQGMRFVYTPKDGQLLQPGFQVAPSFSVVTREEFRDGSGSVADAAEAADPLIVPNTGGSEVYSPNDSTPDDDTATAADETELHWLDPDGDGPDLFDKTWLVDPEVPLYAFSGVARVAHLAWSTEGLPFDSVAFTDDPTAGPLYGDGVIGASAYDAWDLVEIAPIDGDLDPWMQYDRVASVELFDAGVGDWVDVTADACGADGSACDGAFPGYPLSAEQTASTRAVRLVFEEGSGRDGETGPEPGSGVAASYDHDRGIDLVFELRYEKRSDGGPVTGSLHDESYNSGAAGVVKNTAGIVADGERPVAQSDDDLISILDAAADVQVSKEFDQEALPIPPASAGQATYPLATATIVATNATQASVSTMDVSDPAPGATESMYEYLNLYRIDAISVPVDATESSVVLTREGGADPPISIEDALELAPADLADVIGIDVHHETPGTVSIRSGSASTVVLTYQLRETGRASGLPPTAADTAVNVAGAEVARPGGLPDLDIATGTASDTLAFDAADYDVFAGKTITPDSRFEDEPREGYRVDLTGQPGGNVRTTVLSVTDDEATFWNAFTFAGFPDATLPANLHQLRVQVLTGVDYALDEGSGDIVVTCGGSVVLDGCWVPGPWQDTDANSTVTPALPSGVDPVDVLGIRFDVRADADESNWESPFNPIVELAFTADRLGNLRIGPGGEIDSVPVPSTRPDLDPAPGETSAGTITDVVDVHGIGAWEVDTGTRWTADDSVPATTVLRHLPNGIEVEKLPGNGQDGADSQQFPPASEIPYRMTITNTGSWPIEGLVLEDRIQADGSGSMLVPRPGADPVFEFLLDGAAAEGFDAALDPDTGVVAVTVPDGFVLQPAGVLEIRAHLQFRDALPPGTPVANTITATSDRMFDTCDSTSFGTVTNPTVSDVDDCTANTTVNPTAAAPISLEKGVRGVAAGVPGADAGDANYDDLGVLSTTGSPEDCAEPNATGGNYRNICVPITRPGGVERWRLAFTNLGNVPSQAIAGIDVLPAVGDTGVTVPNARGSQWSPIFLGGVRPEGRATTATVTNFYTTTVPSVACNATDIEYSSRGEEVPPGNACASDIAARDWIAYDATTPPEELARAKALKTVAVWPEGDGLAPGTSGAITFDTRTPAWIPDAYEGGLPIAWNSVAAGSLALHDGGEIYQGPVEPVRAGVAAPTGTFELQKEVVTDPVDWPAPLPDAYEANVQCTSDGEEGTITPDPAPVDVPAGGTVVLIGEGTNLPMYADCRVQELPAQGAAVGYDPAGTDGWSGTVSAQRDLTARDDIHHPAPASEESDLITMRNEYELGGFTVSKAIVPGGAEDQEGDLIEFHPTFGFETSCTFLGEEVLGEEFELQDGEQAEFGGVPVGAECTVTETDDAGATTTSIVVTESGVPGEPVDGASVDFTVLPDVDDTHATAVAVTNTYTVGGIEITKRVIGDGTPVHGFTVTLVCTWDQADENPVFHDAWTFPVAGGTWSVGLLPTGAECDIDESDDGGATEATITPEQVAIGIDGTPGDPVLVDVQNDFRVGGFEVEKTVAGSGIGFSAGAVFVFGYRCEYLGETVGEGELTITGDGTAGPFTSEAVTGLPVGADCAITETANGGADATPPPVDVVIPDEDDGVATVVTAPFENRFSAAGLQVTKALDGAGATDPAVVDAAYTVLVTCALTEDADPLFAGEVEVTGNETVTVTDGGAPLILPVGTHCWGEETDAAGATASTVDHDSFENAVVVVPIDEDDPAVLEITATNTFDLADLTIAKELAGGAAEYAEDTEFEILVTCTLDRGGNNDPIVSYDDESVVLRGGGRDTLGDIPVGSTCYAEEPDGQGAWEIEISATEDDPVVVGGDEPVTITVTNVFPDAGFTVAKEVDNGGAVDQSGQPVEYSYVYRFIVVCGFEGETVLDEIFELGDGETRSFTELPAGSDCTVDEIVQQDARTTVVLAQGGVDDDLGETTTATFELQPDDDAGRPTTLMTVTNHYPVGSIEIAKSVTGTGADTWAGAFGDFEVRLHCVHDAVDADVYDDTHTLTVDAPGDVWLVDHLPTGARCAVTEVDAAGATESNATPASTVIDDDELADPVRVDVVNDFRTGALDVLKDAAGPGAPDFSARYVFEAVCTYEGQEVVHRELVVLDDGSGGPFRSETVTGIPVGAECVVTETDPGGADAPAPPVTVVIPDQEEPGVESVVTAGFVNEFSVGTVALAKEVTGDAVDAAAGAVFTVQLTCQLVRDGEPVTLYEAPTRIEAGETVPVAGPGGGPLRLPIGTHCWAVEPDAAGASDVSIDFGSFDDAAVVGRSAEEQHLTITATNTYEAGSLRLEKTVSGAVDQAAGRSFVIEVSCVLGRGDNDPFVAMDAERIVIGPGETRTFDGLPVGAACSAEEVDAGGAASSTVSATVADPVVITADAAVTITVDNRFDPPLPRTGVDGGALLAALGWAVLLLGGGGAALAAGLSRRRRARA
ncbi:DUF5979 domain-containing protein [Agromyces archimandritae]|uniref:Gram-positive cocci surface proteins LPxTG domain-containing protein n=1 Tax=Agromyces archimandritae TaxID=2781962 RepID=A0A975IQ07_9MICO|nr:DUF5979 domain-containing protein [Agromyces archimandritae]QTX05854.1 hypothetical protein G127AT_06560 [Agromyces archimandritae]